LDLGRESRNRGRPLWNAFGLTVGDAWSDFWVWVIGLGAVVGLFLWLMGGWWYHLRLRWSGAQDPNRLKSHLLYVYSSLVVSGPTMIIAFLWTVMLPNYRYVLVQGRRSFIVFPMLVPGHELHRSKHFVRFTTVESPYLVFSIACALRCSDHWAGGDIRCALSCSWLNRSRRSLAFTSLL